MTTCDRRTATAETPQITVRFVKLSDQRHRVEVVRADGTGESVELDTRSFLRHDLAHYAVEAAFGLTRGVWGSVAAGGSFAGDGLDGPDMAVAEHLAGPVQTLMRLHADVDDVRTTLRQHAGDAAADCANALHELMRTLIGRWAATPYRAALELVWPPPNW